MAKYTFVNVKIEGLALRYLSPDIPTGSQLYAWLEELVEAGFKVSFRHNIDYGGFSVTVTDVLTDKDMYYGVSAWGGSVEGALEGAYALVEVIAERGDFRKLPDLVRELEREIADALAEAMPKRFKDTPNNK